MKHELKLRSGFLFQHFLYLVAELYAMKHELKLNTISASLCFLRNRVKVAELYAMKHELKLFSSPCSNKLLYFRVAELYAMKHELKRLDKKL